MKGYWIVKVNVLDIEKQKEYASNAGKAVKKYEGKFLVRGGEQLIKEGKEYERNVIVEFPFGAVFAPACTRSRRPPDLIPVPPSRARLASAGA